MSAVTATRPVEMPTGEPIRRAKGRRWTSYILPTYSWVVIIYLAVPVFVMILFGFNNVPGRVNYQWYGFTLRWYRELFDVLGLGAAIALSLKIAFAATIISTIIGAFLGLAMGRYRFRGAGAVNYLIFLAIASPEIVIGTSLLVMLVNVKFPLGFWSILVAHVMFSISFVAVVIRARVQGLDSSLEEAAQDLGADPVTTFMKVTLPLIAPGVIAAAMLAFALSIDDFVITYFVSGQTVTFPLWVYGSTRIGTPPQVNVLGTLLFMGGVLIAILSALAPKLSESRARGRLKADQGAALRTS